MSKPLQLVIYRGSANTYLQLERSSGKQDGFSYAAHYLDGRWQSSHDVIGILRLLVAGGLVDTEEAEGDVKLADWLKGEWVLPRRKVEKKVKWTSILVKVWNPLQKLAERIK